MKTIVYTVVCSPLDDTLGGEATTRDKLETVLFIESDLRERIPNGYRCSLIIAEKNQSKE